MKYSNCEERLEVINADLHELETRRDNLQLKIDSLESTKLEINEAMKNEAATKLMDAIAQSGKSHRPALPPLPSG